MLGDKECQEEIRAGEFENTKESNLGHVAELLKCSVKDLEKT